MLAALLVARGIGVVAVGRRNGGIVLLDAAAHLREQREPAGLRRRPLRLRRSRSRRRDRRGCPAPARPGRASPRASCRPAAKHSRRCARCRGARRHRPLDRDRRLQAAIRPRHRRLLASLSRRECMVMFHIRHMSGPAAGGRPTLTGLDGGREPHATKKQDDRRTGGRFAASAPQNGVPSQLTQRL